MLLEQNQKVYEKLAKQKGEYCMEHEIELHACLTVPEDADYDEILDLFLEFVESHGWYYGGGFSEIRDGHYVLPDGTLGRPVE